MKKLTALLLSALLSASAMAGVFNQFGPATGILKGSATTPITTAAAWSDVQLLLSGTCNSSVFVRGDGSCVAVSLTSGVSGTLPVANGGTNLTAATDDTVMVGNGTTWQAAVLTDCDSATSAVTYDVTTNAWGCNSITSITGAALTKTNDTNVTLTLGGSPTTALVNAASITAGWTGTLAASRGGLGMSTVTDDTLAVANGSTWESKALANCTDTSGNHLNYTASTNSFSCGTSTSGSTVTPAALTKVDDTNVTLTLGGTPATSLLQATSVTAGWTGTLAASRGGLGMSTVTDDTVAVANGSTWQSKAVPSCADSSGNHLNYDTSTNAFSCGTTSSASTVSGANPSASVGLSAVNGAATTYLRSDGAPALSQAIAPTWSSRHIFTSAYSSGFGVQMNSTTPGLEFYDTDATANTGKWVFDGTNANNFCLAAVPDNYATFRNAVCGVRSGSAISAVNFGNTTDNPAYGFTGTGTTTHSGPVLINGTSGTQLSVTTQSGTAGVVVRSLGATNNPALTITNTESTRVSRLDASGSTSGVMELATSGTARVTLSDTGVQVGAPTGGDKGVGTVNATGLYINGVSLAGGALTSGTFTGTITGMTGTVTCAMKYHLVGSTAFVWSDVGSSCTGTSNTTALTMTGLPSAIQPTRAIEATCIAVDSGAAAPAQCQIAASGSTITFFEASANIGTGKITYGNSFANSGSKGIAAGFGLVYDLGI